MSWNPGKLPVTPEEFDALDEGSTADFMVIDGLIAVVVILTAVIWSLATSRFQVCEGR